MIRKAERKDGKTVLSLFKELWQDADERELKDCFLRGLTGENLITYLASVQGQIAGVVQCSLRRDYVEGTYTTPVGYLEGIFVLPEYRNRGLAKELVKACERWAKEKGCEEFASDCELTNEESRKFHRAAGFDEVGAIVCFAKKI